MSIWACIAGGPSLVAEDINYCREQGWKLATCNMGFQVVPDADLFYAMDYHWWERYGDQVQASLKPGCRLWTGNGSTAAKNPRLKRLQFFPGAGWSTTPGRAYCGDPASSGFHLLQLVGWQNPDLIVLLGYDNMHAPDGRAHHHEEYADWSADRPALNYPNPAKHAGNYEALAEQATVPIINCSRSTALRCFPLVNLRSVPRGTEGIKHAPAAA